MEKTLLLAKKKYMLEHTNTIICKSLHGVHFLVWVTVLYGLLFVQDIHFLFFCIFFTIFIRVSWQITGHCFLNYLENIFDVTQLNIDHHRNSQTKQFAEYMGIQPETISWLIELVVSIVLVIGFYRLYNKLFMHKHSSLSSF